MTEGTVLMAQECFKYENLVIFQNNNNKKNFYTWLINKMEIVFFLGGGRPRTK